jgi:hypothetical protein
MRGLSCRMSRLSSERAVLSMGHFSALLTATPLLRAPVA